MKRARTTGPAPAVPTLTSMHPAAARWIGALIRMTSGHPAMTQILDVIERLQDNPFRTNFLLLGEPGTGKEGLARALHHLTAPAAPLVRFDVVGFPDEQSLAALWGDGGRPGVAEEADGGTILIEETAGLGPRTQAALLRLLKSGKYERAGRIADRRLRVHAIATSDRDLEEEVRAGRFRHDLFYALARVALWLPPLRDRTEDIGPAAVWMGNRILRGAGQSNELMSAEEFARAGAEERAAAIELHPTALRELERHRWSGNFRELEAVLERALMLYRDGHSIGATEIQAAIRGAPGTLPPTPPTGLA